MKNQTSGTRVPYLLHKNCCVKIFKQTDVEPLTENNERKSLKRKTKGTEKPEEVEGAGREHYSQISPAVGGSMRENYSRISPAVVEAAGWLGSLAGRRILLGGGSGWADWLGGESWLAGRLHHHHHHHNKALEAAGWLGLKLWERLTGWAGLTG